MLNITRLAGNPLHDLSPVSALTDLKTLFCYARVYAISTGCAEWRSIPQLTHAEVENLDVLRKTKVTYLVLGTPDKPPLSYDALAGMPLRSLSLQDCPVKDLSFLGGMPLGLARLVLTGTESRLLRAQNLPA